MTKGQRLFIYIQKDRSYRRVRRVYYFLPYDKLTRNKKWFWSKTHAPKGLCWGITFLNVLFWWWFAVRRWGLKLGFGVRALVLGIFPGLASIEECAPRSGSICFCSWGPENILKDDIVFSGFQLDKTWQVNYRHAIFQATDLKSCFISEFWFDISWITYWHIDIDIDIIIRITSCRFLNSLYNGSLCMARPWLFGYIISYHFIIIINYHIISYHHCHCFCMFL